MPEILSGQLRADQSPFEKSQRARTLNITKHQLFIGVRFYYRSSSAPTLQAWKQRQHCPTSPTGAVIGEINPHFSRLGLIIHSPQPTPWLAGRQRDKGHCCTVAAAKWYHYRPTPCTDWSAVCAACFPVVILSEVKHDVKFWGVLSTCFRPADETSEDTPLAAISTRDNIAAAISTRDNIASTKVSCT